MADMWEEVSVVKKENRRELTLHGAEINEKIKASGLDPNIYKLTNLNFLAITNSCLTYVSDSVVGLVNLSSLVLRNNQLKSLPCEIGKLKKLKMLDVSVNKLESFPQEISELVELQSLNASMNKLSSFPDVSGMTALHILNLSHNQLETFPDGITHDNLCHLADVNLCNNAIGEIPVDISNLVHLTTLNLSENTIKNVPLEISQCPKLKELVLTGNKLSDRRLGKMTEQCPTKVVLEYLANALQKQSGEKKGKKDKGKKKKSGKKADDVEELAKNFFSILHFDGDDGLTIQVKQEVLAIRPYFVSCIVRNLNFNKSLNMFKRFINLQTKLHDTVCHKRQAATIATHDLKLIKSPMIYTARPPKDIKIIPLFKTKESTARELVAVLRKEADDLRKEKKRNNVGGVHKYLDLLKDKMFYPCLLDGENQVISFPPITNSDKTKISKDTTEILVEVTSSSNLDVCKAVMDELLKEMLEMGVGAAVEDAAAGDHSEAVGGATEDDVSSAVPEALTVEQVRVIDEEGGLRVVYPSRADLKGDSYEVKRD
ncbi:leucine-rich repeat-containing protein 47-like [Gigantopelta aegis]|uniref:leucine-rich repeat-containing protein 47-like n=1 Tax=Gigantopelta aegis TaxID=1735272 RepID=UPI001B8884DB|nr:leucine-rich repeat-containing protein 47-like [Gigantopelta aegis]